MNQHILYSLLPTLSSEAKDKLSKQARNRAFIKSYLLAGNGGGSPVAAFLTAKSGIDQEIAEADLDAANKVCTDKAAAINARRELIISQCNSSDNYTADDLHTLINYLADGGELPSILSNGC